MTAGANSGSKKVNPSTDRREDRQLAPPVSSRSLCSFVHTHHVVVNMIHVHSFRSQNGRLNVWLSKQEVLVIGNGEVSEKTLQIVWPLLPTEYVILISGRTDTPMVRFYLTDRHKQTTTVTLTAHVHQGLMMFPLVALLRDCVLRTHCLFLGNSLWNSIPFPQG